MNVKQKILIADDSEINRALLMEILGDGYEYLEAENGVRAVELLREHTDIALVLLDIMMPQMDGFEFARTVRKVNKHIPILFMSAKDDLPSKQKGFQLGIDDYMVKPFLPKELILRITAILRRCYKNDKSQLQLAHAVIDFEKAEVIRQGEIFPLTAKEHAILTTLSKAANRIVTIDALCNAAWGDNLYGYENSLMAHIRRIREKIEINPSAPDSLITVRGLGYKLMV